MVAFGLLSGLIPSLIFCISWAFGLSPSFLKVVAYSITLCLLLFALLKINILNFKKIFERFDQLDKLDKLLLFIIVAFLFVNLLGVLAPEVGFDALWYHLTIPKIFLQQGKIDFIPGGLYYYSAMPKLTEIWYMISLLFDNTGTIAKLIHYFYSLGCLYLIYQLGVKLMSSKYAMIAVLTLASALVFCWESGSAYIDLAWTFYVLLAIVLYQRYCEQNKYRLSDIVLTGIASGLAIGTKLPAIIPAVVLATFILKANRKHALIYLITTIFISCPWFLFALLKTGNPIYPFLTTAYPHGDLMAGVSVLNFLKTSWLNLTWPQDPFSIFIGFIGIIFLLPRGMNKTDKTNRTDKTNWLRLYFLINYLAWYFLFRSSGSRFLLPLLPVWIILCLSKWYQSDKRYIKIFYYVLIFSSLFNLVYRSISVSRTLPVIISQRSRQDYLLSRLNFNFGDFYDRDGRVKSIVGNTSVLILGFHNLFYADFNFVHESTTTDRYIFKYWLSDKENTLCSQCQLIYSDKPTNVYLYSLSEFAKI